jgi:hypothetical protein
MSSVGRSTSFSVREPFAEATRSGSVGLLLVQLDTKRPTMRMRAEAE